MRSVSEVGGTMDSWLLGQCRVITPGCIVHGPSLHTIVPSCSTRPRGHHPSHSSRSLSLAFFISRVLYSPPTPPSQTPLAPSLSHRETPVVTISLGKGRDILGNASGSGTRYWARRIYVGSGTTSRNERRGWTTFYRPVSSRALDSPPAGPYGAPDDCEHWFLGARYPVGGHGWMHS